MSTQIRSAALAIAVSSALVHTAASAVVGSAEWSMANTSVIAVEATVDDEPAEAMDRLRADYQALASWLAGKSRIDADGRNEVEIFRRRVVAFRAAHPDDVVAIALELQCATWLGDQAGIDAAYVELARLRPGDPSIAATRAKPLLTAHRYADALELIDGAKTMPLPLALLRARALFGLNRFDEALQTTDLIVGDDLTPELALETEQLRSSILTCRPLWEEETLLRAEETQRDDLPRVQVETDRGTFTIELLEDHAPNTVANMITLAERNFYDGTRFHRVIPGFMAQGGDPNSRPGASGVAGGGGPGYRIPDEHHRGDRRNHFTGSVAMAKTPAPDTAGSQFYVCVAPTPHLNGQHTVFGRVIDGEEIAMALRQNDTIRAVRVLRKRDHTYEVTTLAEQPPSPPPPPPVRNAPPIGR